MRIYLVGFMGCGKSYAGSHLSRKLDFAFVDLDVLFEHRYRIAIPQFFAKYGEVSFRKLEQALLRETVNFHQMVISTGGGTPCHGTAMEWINGHGLSVYLKMSPSGLYHRLSHSRKPRPLIKELSESELRNYIHERLAGREPYYNQAHLTVGAENLDLNRLAAQVKEALGRSAFSDE